MIDRKFIDDLRVHDSAEYKLLEQMVCMTIKDAVVDSSEPYQILKTHLNPCYPFL